MSADWIKMRGNLWDDPRVARLCDITESGEATVIGGLYWLWASADQHTVDGFMPGLSLRQIDRKTGIAGFGAALCAIGWLTEYPDGVRIEKFDDHNGASAKRRSTDAQRKGSVRKMSASDADKVRTDCGQAADELRNGSGQPADVLTTGCGQTADELRRIAELEKEKEKEKEEKKKEDAPASPPDARIFSEGVAFMTRCGVKESNARSFLGKLRREMADDLALLELLERAERLEVVEPLSWLRAAADAIAKKPKVEPLPALPGEYFGPKSVQNLFGVGT